MSLSRLIAPAAALIAAGLMMYSCSPARTGSSVRDANKRVAAPDFALKDESGRTAHLSDYRGRVVLLDFWATWCGPCNVEIPWFTQFERTYKNRGFQVLGVSMDDGGWKDIAPFVRRNSINYPILLGDTAMGTLYGGVEGLPTTFLIDREGRVAAMHEGLVDKEEFENAIQKLLDAPSGDSGAARAGARRANGA